MGHNSMYNALPTIKRVIQPPLTSGRGTFTGTFWFVEDVNGKIEKWYSESAFIEHDINEGIL